MAAAHRRPPCNMCWEGRNRTSAPQAETRKNDKVTVGFSGRVIMADRIDIDLRVYNAQIYISAATVVLR